MGIEVSIDKNKRYAIFTLIGDTSFIDIRSKLDFSSQPFVLHGMPMIWDFRLSDLSKTQRLQIDKIAVFFDQQIDMLDKIRVACVVDTDIQYGLCKMLQYYMDNHVVEIKTFKNYEEAIRWIKI